MSIGDTPEFDIDECFVELYRDLVEATIKVTSEAVEQIMVASQSFLGDSIQSTIRDFHILYSDETKNQTADINAVVDAMVESIRREIEAGNSGSEIIEDEVHRKARLGLAAVQKKIETLIQFDEKAREQLVPVLMSMQFEDEIRQVLRRLATMLDFVVNESSGLTLEQFKRRFTSQSLTTMERELLFKIVFNEESPPILVETGDFFQFLKNVS